MNPIREDARKRMLEEIKHVVAEARAEGRILHVADHAAQLFAAYPADTFRSLQRPLV